MNIFLFAQQLSAQKLFSNFVFNDCLFIVICINSYFVKIVNFFVVNLAISDVHIKIFIKKVIGLSVVVTRFSFDELHLYF